MKKIGIFICALMLLLPALASAYTLQVKVAGGKIGVNTVTVNGVTTGNSGTYNTTSPNTGTVTPTTSVAFATATLTVNGVTTPYVAGTPIAPVYATGSTTLWANQYLYITFPSASSYTVTANQLAGGSVFIQQTAPSLSSNVTTALTGIGGTATVVVSVYPDSTKIVTAIKVGSNPATNPMTGGVTPGTAAKVTLTAAELQSNPTVSATYSAATYTTTAALSVSPSTVVNGVTTSSVAAGGTVTLDARGSVTNDTAIATYNFIVTGSPALTTVVPGKVTFTAPATGPITASVQVTSTNGSTNTSAAQTITIFDKYQAQFNQCGACHNGRNPGLIADFQGSPHWLTPVNDGLSAGVVNTCGVQQCHFRNSTSFACQTCHSDSLLASGAFKNNSSSHSFRTPTSENNCMVCHEGSHHGGPTLSYEKSAHFLNPYGEVVVDCFSCHNPHSTTAAFPGYDATTYKKNAGSTCDNCHAGQYAIFGALSTMKQPHAAYKTFAVPVPGSQSLGFYSKSRFNGGAILQNISSSYVTAGQTCKDCHGHNNSVNAEYATTMHADPMGRWKGSDYWKFRGFSSANATTITHSNSATDGCVRCHTTTGFVNFVNTGFNDLRAWGFKNLNDKTTELIACSACHNTDNPGGNPALGYPYNPAGAVAGERTIALPEGPVDAADAYSSKSIRMYNAAYPAYYNYSTLLAGKFINTTHGATGTAIMYNDMKNSNVCVPCHSGRSGNSTNGAVIKTLGTFAAFTTLAITNNAVPGAPHGVYQAAILDGKIGYQFTAYTTAVNGHAALGTPRSLFSAALTDNNGRPSVAGPCVTCHMDRVAPAAGGYRKHSFGIYSATTAAALPNVCSTCHGSTFQGSDLKAAQANFQAAVAALDAFLKTSNNIYGTPILKGYLDKNGSYKTTYADAVLVADGTGQKVGTAGVLKLGTSFVGKTAKFADLVGAVYNYNLLWGAAYGTTDVGAYAHNPAYLKQLVYDTINALRNTTTTTSVADAIGQAPTAAASGTYPGFTAAQQTAAVTFVQNPANHYATGTYKVQYMVGAATCATCHNPAETDLQAAARVAWAGSDHGNTLGTAWTPSSSHAWRAAGVPQDFSVLQPAGNDCIRCHTADGYVQFESSSYTNVAAFAGDNGKVNSPLDCQTCHVNPLNATSDRLAPAAVSTFYNVSTNSASATGGHTVKSRVAATFPNVGESNLCIACHSARLTGQNLVDMYNTGFWNLSSASFQNSHYDAAAGVMYLTAGFKNFTTLTAPAPSNVEGAAFASSKTYRQTLFPDSASMPSIGVSGGVSSSHRRLGTALIDGSEDYLTAAGPGHIDTNGPCVTCHLKAYNPVAATNGGVTFTPPVNGRPGAGHSLQIDDATGNQLCLQCHNDAPNLKGGDGAGHAITVQYQSFADLQSVQLEGQRQALQDGLTLIKQILAVKYKIKYDSANYPYFYDLQVDPSGKTSVTDWTRKNVDSSAAVAALTSTTIQPLPAGGLTKVQAMRLMGACFNLNLLGREPGAYVHARTYTQRLVFDTVDYLDDLQANFTALTSARNMTTANVTVPGVASLAGVYVGNNVNVLYANSGSDVLATESMAWLTGTHYTNGAGSAAPVRMKIRP